MGGPIPPIVACADIGSIPAGRFGFAIRYSEGHSESGENIRTFVEQLGRLLDGKHQVAIGFECPLFVPLPRDPAKLTSARPGEGSRPWSAGAGCGALATGLTEVAWILRELKARATPSVRALTTWPAEGLVNGDLLLWEAFVTAGAKAGTHHGDASVAVEAFLRAWPRPDLATSVTVEHSYSLLGAALLRTEWTIDIAVLSSQCLVIKA